MSRDLPVLNGEPVCPHAFPIMGATRAMRGVVCRVMQDDCEGDAGLRMSPRDLELVRGTEGGVYLNLKNDPSSVTAFCYGNALPRTSETQPARAHHTFCPIWEAWDERRRAGKRGLYDEAEPESVSMGVDGTEGGLAASHTLEASDPWRQAREDLDVLAPPKAA